MHYRIHHASTYSYSQPVFLDPHRIRLHPRNDGAQRLLQYELSISPIPSGHCSSLEPEQCIATEAWFDGLHRELTITMTSDVETFRKNPFDFLPHPLATALPFRLPDRLIPLLRAYLPRSESPIHPSVIALAGKVARQTGYQTLAFLQELNQMLFDTIKMVERTAGSPLPPQELIERRKGACRDIAVLYIACCQSQGIPARFVSGYHEGDDLPAHRRLHAWAEVYLPGGGWRGYDPSLGLAAADRHISVCASAAPSLTLPVEGTYRGDGAVSHLETSLHIEVLPEPARPDASSTADSGDSNMMQAS